MQQKGAKAMEDTNPSGAEATKGDEHHRGEREWWDKDGKGDEGVRGDADDLGTKATVSTRKVEDGFRRKETRAPKTTKGTKAMEGTRTAQRTAKSTETSFGTKKKGRSRADGVPRRPTRITQGGPPRGASYASPSITLPLSWAGIRRGGGARSSPKGQMT